MAEQFKSAAVIVSTEQMSYYPKEKNFFGFASDCLGALRDQARAITRIYPDAEDRGILVRSHKTGELAWFFLKDMQENEMIFRPTPEAIRKNPALHGVRISLAND